MKKVQYEEWIEKNQVAINNLMGYIFKSLHKLNVPVGMDFEFDYDDSLKEQLLLYMYNNSSSAIRIQ
jgi:hypothetical protein